jgi:hypothetical protein
MTGIPSMKLCTHVERIENELAGVVPLPRAAAPVATLQALCDF